MNTIPVLSNVPKSYGFDSVAIPAAAQTVGFIFVTLNRTLYASLV